MIEAVIDESVQRDKVTMSTEVMLAMKQLREFMFERVYLRSEAVAQSDRARVVIHQLVEYTCAHIRTTFQIPTESPRQTT